jgi:hypothetical protein
VAEFLFKNLSVKLFRAEGEEGQACEPCTELCTACTAANTDCTECTNCTEGTCQVCTCGFDTEVLIVSEPEFSSPRDVHSELAAHRTHLKIAYEQAERLQHDQERRAKLEQTDPGPS